MIDDIDKKHAALIEIQERIAHIAPIVALRSHRGFQILLGLLDVEIERLKESCCAVGSPREQTEVDRAQLALLRQWRDRVTKDLPAQQDELEQEAEGLRNDLLAWQNQYALGPTEPAKAKNP